MSYTIKINIDAYTKWAVFQNPAMIFGSTRTLSEKLLEQYQELLATEYGRDGYRIFTFESEQHYHWFLLKVS